MNKSNITEIKGQENAWRANQERGETQWWSDDQSVCIKRLQKSKKGTHSKLQHFPLIYIDSDGLIKPPVPYSSARLVLMQHRPQRWDPTSSHMRQFPSVSFWHTAHHLSELHFPPATASIQKQHCYLVGVAACHTQEERNGGWVSLQLT